MPGRSSGRAPPHAAAVQNLADGGEGPVGELGDLAQGPAGRILLKHKHDQPLEQLRARARRRSAPELWQRLQLRTRRVRHQTMVPVVDPARCVLGRRRTRRSGSEPICAGAASWPRSSSPSGGFPSRTSNSEPSSSPGGGLSLHPWPRNSEAYTRWIAFGSDHRVPVAAASPSVQQHHRWAIALAGDTGPDQPVECEVSNVNDEWSFALPSRGCPAPR